MNALRDEFLSEEDLDLKTLSGEELERVWNEWLKAAQATNKADRDTYSHGVFVREPSTPGASAGSAHIRRMGLSAEGTEGANGSPGEDG